MQVVRHISGYSQERKEQDDALWLSDLEEAHGLCPARTEEELELRQPVLYKHAQVPSNPLSLDVGSQKKAFEGIDSVSDIVVTFRSL
jgi:hypothetical protein